MLCKLTSVGLILFLIYAVCIVPAEAQGVLDEGGQRYLNGGGGGGGTEFVLPPIVVTPDPSFNTDGTALFRSLRDAQERSMMGQERDPGGGGGSVPARNEENSEVIEMPPLQITVDENQNDEAQVSLDSADIELLREIARRERAADFASGLLTFGPLASLFTTDQTSFSFSVISTDWAGYANALEDLNTIEACSISMLIQGHMDGLSGDKLGFFRNMEEAYSSKC